MFVADLGHSPPTSSNVCYSQWPLELTHLLRLVISVLGLAQIRYGQMPRKRKTPASNNQFNDFRSVFLNPSYTEEAELHLRYEKGEIGSLSTLPELIDLGWKVSFSYADNHETYWVSATYKGKNHVTLQNTCLMSKHREMDKAYALVEQVIFIEIEDKGNIEFIPPSNDSW